MYRIELKQDLTEQDYREWEQLWNDSPFPKVYNSKYWFMACKSAFKGKYSVVYIYKDEKLNVIIPLKSFCNLVFVSPGGKYLDKSSNLFADPYDENLSDIIQEFFKGKCLIFNEVPETELEFYGKSDYCRVSSVNPYAIIDEGLSSISKRTKKKLDKIIAESNNAFSIKVYKSNIKENINTIFQIEENSNKVERKKALFTNDEIKKFFEDISSYPGARLFVLYYNDTPIAHTYDFLNGRYLTGCHTAYLDEYKKMMPGKMLTYLVMEYCKENGIGVYDFSRGECDKKAQFAKDKCDNYNLYYANIVIITCIKFFFNFIKVLKSIKRKMREAKIIK